MNAAALKAKIATDHQRLRDLQARMQQIPPSERRQYDGMLAQAKKDITLLEIQLAGMDESGTCPACGDEMPLHFTVCRPCWLDVPFKLYVAYKGASGIAHARQANGHKPDLIAAAETNEKHARLAVLSHLKQHSTAIAA